MDELVAEVKRLLPDPTKRIELDDYISDRVREFFDATSLEKFPVQGLAVTREAAAERIARYEELASDLQAILALVAKWATPQQAPLLESAFSQLAESDKGSSGLTVWLSLGWYPALYLMYSAGISALASKNYAALAAILLAPVEDDERLTSGQVWPAAAKIAGKVSESSDAFKLLPGRERNHVPRSEHLFESLQKPLDAFLHIGKRYEAFFDIFEVFLALVYAEFSGSGWVPVGRFGYKHAHDVKRGAIACLKSDIEREGAAWPPFRSGLAGGSPDGFAKLIEVAEKHIQRLNWY